MATTATAAATSPAPAAPRWRLPRFGAVAKVGWVTMAYLFLLAPMVVVIGSSLDGTTAYSGVVFPPQDLTLRWYREIPATHYRALGLSLVLALCVACGACVLGIPAALAVVRGRLPGKS
jgi:putative spermidine/putrescine transport system permease protein